MTPYQTLQVFESDGVRTLKGDRVPQAAVSLATHRLMRVRVTEDGGLEPVPGG